VLTRQVL